VIVDDGGDLSAYATIEAAQNDIEPPDVRNGALRYHDSTGLVLDAHVDAAGRTILHPREPKHHEADELLSRVRLLATRVPQRLVLPADGPPTSWDLPQAVAWLLRVTG